MKVVEQKQHDLAECLVGIHEIASTPFQHLCLDSRLLQAGDVFVAMQGEASDGHQYIENVLARGAVAVLAERDEIKDPRVIVIANLREKLGVIASRYYGNPSAEMQIIGVTGTNGKSSITHFVSQSLRFLQRRCAVIGTLGNGFLPDLEPSANTTPDAISLQAILAHDLQQGADSVAMEVSSHGLQQERVNGVQFDIAVFSNISRDHLDYHESMEAYKAQKKRLFTRPGLSHCILNLDDEMGRELAQELKGKVPIIGYGLENHDEFDCPKLITTEFTQNFKGFKATLKTPWGEGELRSKLLGQFNILNLLAVLGVLLAMDVKFQDALDAVNQVETVPGRMMSFGGGRQALVVVDYAHTPDALEQALTSLRPHTNGTLWCVFGCGGDRDRGKRELMGQIAERFSDQLIITNDNPRHEMPLDIVDDIKSGLICAWAAEVELDREAAIAHAIDCAEPGDVVLIAGKGHEAYQIIGDEKTPFSDIELVRQQTADKRLR